MANRSPSITLMISFSDAKLKKAYLNQAYLSRVLGIKQVLAFTILKTSNKSYAVIPNERLANYNVYLLQNALSSPDIFAGSILQKSFKKMILQVSLTLIIASSFSKVTWAVIQGPVTLVLMVSTLPSLSFSSVFFKLSFSKLRGKSLTIKILFLISSSPLLKRGSSLNSLFSSNWIVHACIIRSFFL